MTSGDSKRDGSLGIFDANVLHVLQVFCRLYLKHMVCEITLTSNLTALVLCLDIISPQF